MGKNKKKGGGGGGGGGTVTQQPPAQKAAELIPTKPAAIVASTPPPTSEDDAMKLRLAEAKERLNRIQKVIEAIGVEDPKAQISNEQMEVATEKLESIVATASSESANEAVSAASVSNSGGKKKKQKKGHNLNPPLGSPIALPINQPTNTRSVPEKTKDSTESKKETRAEINKELAEAVKATPDADAAGDEDENGNASKKKRNRNKNKNKQQAEQQSNVSTEVKSQATAEVAAPINVPSSATESITPTAPESVAPTAPELAAPPAPESGNVPLTGGGKKKNKKNKNKNTDPDGKSEDAIIAEPEKIPMAVEKILDTKKDVVNVIEKVDVAKEKKEEAKLTEANTPRTAQIDLENTEQNKSPILHVATGTDLDGSNKIWNILDAPSSLDKHPNVLAEPANIESISASAIPESIKPIELPKEMHSPTPKIKNKNVDAIHTVCDDFPSLDGPSKTVDDIIAAPANVWATPNKMTMAEILKTEVKADDLLCEPKTEPTMEEIPKVEEIKVEKPTEAEKPVEVKKIAEQSQNSTELNVASENLPFEALKQKHKGKEHQTREIKKNDVLKPVEITKQTEDKPQEKPHIHLDCQQEVNTKEILKTKEQPKQKDQQKVKDTKSKVEKKHEDVGLKDKPSMSTIQPENTLNLVEAPIVHKVSKNKNDPPPKESEKTTETSKVQDIPKNKIDPKPKEATKVQNVAKKDSDPPPKESAKSTEAPKVHDVPEKKNDKQPKESTKFTGTTKQSIDKPNIDEKLKESSKSKEEPKSKEFNDTKDPKPSESPRGVMKSKDTSKAKQDPKKVDAPIAEVHPVPPSRKEGSKSDSKKSTPPPKSNQKKESNESSKIEPTKLTSQEPPRAVEFTETPQPQVPVPPPDAASSNETHPPRNDQKPKKDQKSKVNKAKGKAPMPPSEEHPPPDIPMDMSIITLPDVSASVSVAPVNGDDESQLQTSSEDASLLFTDSKNVPRSGFAQCVETVTTDVAKPQGTDNQQTPLPPTQKSEPNLPVSPSSPASNKRNKNHVNQCEAKKDQAAQLLEILEPKPVTGLKPGAVAGTIRVAQNKQNNLQAPTQPRKRSKSPKEIKADQYIQEQQRQQGAIPKTKPQIAPKPDIHKISAQKTAPPQSPPTVVPAIVPPAIEKPAAPLKHGKPEVPPRPKNLVPSPKATKKPSPITCTASASTSSASPSPLPYDEEEYVEYKFSPRPVFMATICQVCKIPLQSFVHCKQCQMINYCTVEHLQEDEPGHRSLCVAIQEIAKKRGGHIYNNARILSDDDYRSLRVHTLNILENTLKRHLQPFEREILLFPRLCCTGSCREWRQPLITECKGCGQVSHCIANPTHLPDAHAKWCKAFALYQKLVVRQKNYGRIEPSLPSKIMSKQYQLPNTIDEAFKNLYKNYGAIKDECTYAALTQLATAPLTAYYAAQQSGRSISEHFTIHLIGAELQFEADTLDKWETFFLHLAPQLIELHVVFVGPELNAENLPLEILSRIRMCRTCRQSCRAVKFDFQCGKLYHQYAQSTAFCKPDLICFYNPGLYRATGFNGLDTWPDTIKAAVSFDCPIAVTSYTEVEAPRDLDRLQREAGRELQIIQAPHINPFTSQRPERNFISDEIAPMIFKNFYCFTCK